MVGAGKIGYDKLMMEVKRITKDKLNLGSHHAF